MSINVSQIFVRYPDPQDAAEVLRDGVRDGPAFVAVKTPGPWLAVAASTNEPAPEQARLLSRALEAQAVWYGLAGGSLAYRFLRYSLGREEEQVIEPPEMFRPDTTFVLPAYRDAERELHARLVAAGLPPEYLYLFFEEFGVAGGGEKPADAALVRDGSVQPFVHRVPRRGPTEVRTLFDEVHEEERRVCETLRLRGSFDEARARQLFQTLEAVCRRRIVPDGWKVRYVAEGLPDPELGRSLEKVHAAGGYSYEFTAAIP